MFFLFIGMWKLKNNNNVVMLLKVVRMGEEKLFGNFSRMLKKDVIIFYLFVLL